MGPCHGYDTRTTSYLQNSATGKSFGQGFRIQRTRSKTDFDDVDVQPRHGHTWPAGSESVNVKMHGGRRRGPSALSLPFAFSRHRTINFPYFDKLRRRESDERCCCCCWLLHYSRPACEAASRCASVAEKNHYHSTTRCYENFLPCVNATEL